VNDSETEYDSVLQTRYLFRNAGIWWKLSAVADVDLQAPGDDGSPASSLQRIDKTSTNTTGVE